MNIITKLEELAKAHSRDRIALTERVNAFHDERRQLARRRLPGIKSAVARAKESEDALRAAIQENADTFEGKSRTITIHGLRIGITKGKGRLQLSDPKKVVALIRKRMPDEADVLIITKESPDKKALGRLSSSQLKQLGCEIVDTGDAIMIKPVDSEVDKLVNRLLTEHEDIEA